MDAHGGTQQTAPMDNFDNELMELAEQTALEAFGEQMELEHIVAVYQTMAWMRKAGLPTSGVATVH